MDYLPLEVLVKFKHTDTYKTQKLRKGDKFLKVSSFWSFCCSRGRISYSRFNGFIQLLILLASLLLVTLFSQTVHQPWLSNGLCYTEVSGSLTTFPILIACSPQLYRFVAGV